MYFIAKDLMPFIHVVHAIPIPCDNQLRCCEELKKSSNTQHHSVCVCVARIGGNDVIIYHFVPCPSSPPSQGQHWFGEDGLVKTSNCALQPELLRPNAVEYANVHQCREELQVHRNVSFDCINGHYTAWHMY